jgi:hypothetical protein
MVGESVSIDVESEEMKEDALEKKAETIVSNPMEEGERLIVREITFLVKLIAIEVIRPSASIVDDRGRNAGEAPLISSMRRSSEITKPLRSVWCTFRATIVVSLLDTTPNTAGSPSAPTHAMGSPTPPPKPAPWMVTTVPNWNVDGVTDVTMGSCRPIHAFGVTMLLPLTTAIEISPSPKTTMASTRTTSVVLVASNTVAEEPPKFTA